MYFAASPAISLDLLDALKIMCEENLSSCVILEKVNPASAKDTAKIAITHHCAVITFAYLSIDSKLIPYSSSFAFV